MRILAFSFLLLALSLPAFAHHGRHEREFRHGWSPRQTMIVEEGPRFIRERPWTRHPRFIVRECDHERERFFAPVPPPVLVRPRVRLWLGF